LVQCT